MRIAHITSSISRVGAGVSKIVRDLAEAQADQGDTIHILTLEDRFTETDRPKHKGINISASSPGFLKSFGYSGSFKKILLTQKDSVDIFHMHGLWMYPNWAAGNVARKSKLPYIISPHGMLDSRSLQLKKWKKIIARFAYEDTNIGHAGCLHACSEMEAEHIRYFGYTGPIAIIPSGLAIPEQQKKSLSMQPRENMIFRNYPHLKNKQIILYLSRLHEQKGLHFLLDAWKCSSDKFSDWHLIVAGGGEPVCVSEFKKKVQDEGLTKRVTFVGPVYGDYKWSLIKSAGLFVLPTHSENFGLVVAEALACGVPVITTKGTPWSDLEKEDCGWWIDVGAKPLEECLAKALSLSGSRLAEMGERGRRLVESKYVIDITARTMRTVYDWMLNSGARPECVLTE